jgi:aryl sulfotransferase
MRDGRDVAVSLYHHCLPLFPEDSIELSFDLSFDSLFLSVGTQKNWTMDENGWFGHMAGWLANKKKLNILYIKYEDLLEDLEGNIRKVGDFCGIKINEADLPRILERCSFKFMKKHQDKLDARRTGKMVFKKKANDFIRKGKSKEWKHYFSKELIQDYEYLFNKFLGDFNLDCYKPTGVENH